MHTLITRRLVHLRPCTWVAMTQVRYGVGGEPVTHSLSPMLMGLIVRHLSENAIDIKSRQLHEINLERMDVIPATRIEDALAWGYVGELPGQIVNWESTASPLSAFRARTLIERISKSVTEIVQEPDSRLEPLGTAELPVKNKRIPGAPNERWLSITSPLKHQLSGAAMKFVDAGKDADCINALRWNTREWWVASTDGIGLVHVANHRGIDIAAGAVLDLHGGGGAARSCAAAWSKAGGKIRWSGGRRELAEDGPWAKSLLPAENHYDADLSINFDVSPAVKDDVTGQGLVMMANYSLNELELEAKFEALASEPLDGRWLLCAQHLASWSTLWCPNRAQDLPSLELLLTRLLHAENQLADYR